MLKLITAVLIVLAPIEAWAADRFAPTESKVWEEYQWESPPLPVPKGWIVKTGRSKILKSQQFYFQAIPSGESNSAWLKTGVDVRRFHYGAPAGASRDSLHLTYVKAIASSATDHELLAWQEFGDVRASLHAITGPKGEEEIDLVLSHWGPDNSIYVMTAFSPIQDYREAGVANFAGSFFEALIGEVGLSEQIAVIEPQEKIPPQSKPYTMSSKTRDSVWAGRVLKFPVDWQVTNGPIYQGLEHGLSMRVNASPNLNDPDAPTLVYRREPGAEDLSIRRPTWYKSSTTPPTT